MSQLYNFIALESWWKSALHTGSAWAVYSALGHAHVSPWNSQCWEATVGTFSNKYICRESPEWAKPERKVLTFRITATETSAVPQSFYSESKKGTSVRSLVVMRPSRSLWMRASAKSTKCEWKPVRLQTTKPSRSNISSVLLYRKSRSNICTAGTNQHHLYENKVQLSESPLILA